MWIMSSFRDLIVETECSIILHFIKIIELNERIKIIYVHCAFTKCNPPTNNHQITTKIQKNHLHNYNFQFVARSVNSVWWKKNRRMHFLECYRLNNLSRASMNSPIVSNSFMRNWIFSLFHNQLYVLQMSHIRKFWTIIQPQCKTNRYPKNYIFTTNQKCQVWKIIYGWRLKRN